MMPLETAEPLEESPEYQGFLKFARLTQLKRDLNEQLREVEQQLDALESALLPYFGQGGYQTISLGGYTLAPVRVPWVYPLAGVSRQTVCEALKLSGLGRLVKEEYSTQSLTLYVKELEDHHKLMQGQEPGELKVLLPTPLQAVLEAKRAHHLRATRSKKASSFYNRPEPDRYEE